MQSAAGWDADLNRAAFAFKACKDRRQGLDALDARTAFRSNHESYDPKPYAFADWTSADVLGTGGCNLGR